MGHSFKFHSNFKKAKPCKRMIMNPIKQQKKINPSGFSQKTAQFEWSFF